MARKPDALCAGGCGKLLWRGSKSLEFPTCQDCRSRSSGRAPAVGKYRRTCSSCGVDFLAFRRDGRFCSRSCVAGKSRGGNNVPAPHVCPVCSAVFFNSRHDRKKFCGDLCKYVAKHGSSCAVSFPECASCFAPMPPKSRSKYCNEACAWRTKGRRHRVWFPTCMDCGLTFCGRTASVLRCSPCRVHHYWLRKPGRRKASKLVDYIGHRDKWKCGICGCKVSADSFEHGNPQSKTVDHIVPESECRVLGWTQDQIDDPANLRVAHMRCNSLRSANGGGEQLALVG